MLSDQPAPKPATRFFPLTVFVATLWIIELFDLAVTNGRLDAHGIRPRTVEGLDGVLWAPWLHGGLGHLISNTLPLLLLGGLIAFRGAGPWTAITTFIAVIGGLATWLLARPSIHIGASLIVFGYITFLITVGFFEGRPLGILLGFAVLFLYGGTLLWGLLPIQRGVSWEGHLFGAAAGIGAAWLAGEVRRDRLPD